MWKYGWFFSSKSGRKLDLWLFGMTLSRSVNETQMRLSSWNRYKGNNFKNIFFAWQHACKIVILCSISMLRRSVFRLLLQILNHLVVVKTSELVLWYVFLSSTLLCTDMNVLLKQNRLMDMKLLEKICCQRICTDK